MEASLGKMGMLPNFSEMWRLQEMSVHIKNLNTIRECFVYQQQEDPEGDHPDITCTLRSTGNIWSAIRSNPSSDDNFYTFSLH